MSSNVKESPDSGFHGGQGMASNRQHRSSQDGLSEELWAVVRSVGREAPRSVWLGGIPTGLNLLTLGMDAEVSMSRLSWLQKLYWSHLGKPVTERSLLRYLVHHEVSSILEIGVGNCQRMRRIAKLVQAPEGTDAIRYIGTDEFEAANDDLAHLSLKQAHQIAGSLHFKASLIPGDPMSALPRVAHKMGASDLIIINGHVDPEQPENSQIASWFNRLAHADSKVFACTRVGEELRQIDTRQFELPLSRAA